MEYKRCFRCGAIVSYIAEDCPASLLRENDWLTSTSCPGCRRVLRRDIHPALIVLTVIGTVCVLYFLCLTVFWLAYIGVFKDLGFY